MESMPNQIKFIIEFGTAIALVVSNYFLLREMVKVLEERQRNCKEACMKWQKEHRDDNECDFQKNREDHRMLFDKIENIKE